ncbi:hypothetical protein KP509_36G059300 [Ceratopteris richardii]|uniref:Uncharacterized protein n=1 Tax=Ceratopteris richardii TaxID=49495 RepID=A0A8T2QE36_CERRI|nr:hypothetical protein KP509_36G059300 [Ceratopteris richardii]
MAHAERVFFDHAMAEEFDFPGSDDDIDEFQDFSRDDQRNEDITAAQARRGKDIQGIPWDRLRFTREEYRENRLQQYKNYENLNVPHEYLEKECLQVTTGGKYYAFRHNTKAISSTVVHFQLRNLIWATSKHDVYGMHESVVWHWSSLDQRKTDIRNATRPFVPVPEARRSTWALQSVVRQMQISTMCVKNNLLVAGGFHGEMACKFLDRIGVSYCTKSV